MKLFSSFITLTLFSSLVLSIMTLQVKQANADEIKGNANAAKSKVAMCIGCHAINGYKASFPKVYDVPYIGGQNAKYLEKTLKSYQQGDRKNPTMRSVVSNLSDQEIADISAYYSQQNSNTSANSIK